jgi:tetratricopeptide (TPR) repeat protein
MLNPKMTMKCNKCDKEFPDNANFCPNCGEGIAKPIAVCQSCQTQNSGNAKFCQNCGAPLKKAIKAEKVISSTQLSNYPYYKNPFFIIMVVALLGMIIGIFYTIKLVKPKNEQAIAERTTEQTQSIPNNEVQSAVDLQHIEETANRLKQEPDNIGLNIEMGNLLFDSQRFSEAVPYYEKAIALDSKKADVIVDLGVCYFNIENYDKAKQLFEDALKSEPNHVNALYNVGVVAIRLKEMDVLMDAWGQLVKIAPDSPQALQASTILDEIHKNFQKDQSDN